MVNWAELVDPTEQPLAGHDEQKCTSTMIAYLNTFYLFSQLMLHAATRILVATVDAKLGAGLSKLILESSVLPQVQKNPSWVSENGGYDHRHVSNLFGCRHLYAFRQRHRVRAHRRGTGLHYRAPKNAGGLS